MSLSEIPHSVVVEPNPDPDSDTLARGTNGKIRLVEPLGRQVRRVGHPVDRRFILHSGVDTSIVFKTTPELDLVTFYRPEDQMISYAARNGVFVELGKVNPGGRIGAQYSLEDGTMIYSSADKGAFTTFEAPESIDPSSVALIRDACQELKANRKTPSPAILSELQAFIPTIIITKPTAITPALFL